ncbi:hypothetical protein [Trabulsiella odontotermitis]|uniref:hypothetical protein n=1 Tax=Trabulsiella odontotermitis TaxID=379893 RepID=UPI0006760B8D|nr:hypothetical protein [Trabulsiella odontotermitis]KNC93619.1 hypothetical protein GM30_18110 [Trabulsiella odontotermitis]
MDMAKILVSSVVIGVIGGILTLLSAPVVGTIAILVLIGLGLNSGLNHLDDQLSLSATLKAKIREFYHLHDKSIVNSNAYELQYLF